MYEALEDPYCYPRTTVLKNRAGLRTQRALTRFETAMAAQRADEALPLGRLSVRHYCDIHRHLFQDVYAWAGKFRTVRISKAGSMFCYPEHIPREMRSLFDRLKYDQYLRELADHDFVGQAAHFLATLNAIHPFRDGNGRTQLGFLALLATKAGHQLALTGLRPRMFRAAMVTSFHGDEAPLRRELRRLLDQPIPRKRRDHKIARGAEAKIARCGSSLFNKINGL